MIKSCQAVLICFSMRELENNLITFSDMLLEKVLRGYQRRAMSIAGTEL